MVSFISHIRLAFIFLLILARIVVYSQGPPFLPYNTPPAVISGSYNSGVIKDSSVNVVLNSLQISNAADYDVKARYYIHMPPGNYALASSLTTGSFHAHIKPPQIEVVSYHPNGFTQIPVYDKFELGIKLPQNITDSVNNFFGNKNAIQGINGLKDCPLGSGNILDTNFINPYDPDQISLEATFSMPGQSDKTIYGFYYREYNYQFQTGNSISYTNTEYVEDTTLIYHWRVRFAPKFVGTYRVRWKVKRNNQIVLQDTLGQYITTIASSNKGYLKIGSSGKFLVTQPINNGPQESIIPLGVVEAFPPAAKAIGCDYNDDMPNSDCLCPGDCNYTNATFPSRYWRHREKIKTKIALSGGNLVRVFGSPYSYNIEWEKAGVYDASPTKPIGPGIPPIAPAAYYKGINRQTVMWEMDRLLEMAKESTANGNPFYLQWVTEGNEDGFITTPNNAWPNNPYYSIINNPAPNTINQFFTDTIARKYYKKRLRYLISRYGYSTNIMCYELVNEIQQFGGFIAPGTTLNQVFANWLTIMTDYIRNPISSGGLGHTDQLLTVSIEPTLGADSIVTVPKLDFLSRHPYYYDLNKNYAAYKDIQDFKNLYSKPCQAGELGLASTWGCALGNQSLTPEFITPTFHSLLWSTTFIGGLTSGLANWDGGLDVPLNNPNNYLCGEGFRQHFNPLRSFISNIDFNGDNYVPGFTSPNYIPGSPPTSDSSEAFYLINNQGTSADHVIGYLRNRTFHWRNFMQSNNNPFYDQNYTDVLTNMLDSCSSFFNSLPANPVLTGNPGNMDINGLLPSTTFSVSWFGTFSSPNPNILNQIVSSDNNGVLILSPPPFSNTDCEGQEYGFKIRLPGQMREAPPQMDLSTILPDTATITFANTKQSEFIKSGRIKNEVNDIKYFKIFPNPGQGIYTVYASIKDEYVLEITNAYGSVLKTISFIGKVFNLNIEDLSNGIYFIKLTGNNGSYFQKIVKKD